MTEDLKIGDCAQVMQHTNPVIQFVMCSHSAELTSSFPHVCFMQISGLFQIA